MKIKHLKARLTQTLSLIEERDAGSIVSGDDILEISGVFSALITEAQLRLQEGKPLGAEDVWLLDVFKTCRMYAEFNDTFERICATAATDFDRLYTLSCTFFYRQLADQNNELTSIHQYREIMRSAVGDDMCARLIKKLKQFGVVS